MADKLLQEDGTNLLLEDGSSILLKENIGWKPGAPPIVRKPKLQFRRGTTAEWAAANPVLALGEPGVDLTNGDFKVGDGSTAWNSMPLKYVPASFATSAPRGFLAEGWALNGVTINAGSFDIAGGLVYEFDPTRRYRANYTIRAQSASSSIQFQLVNAYTGGLLGSPSDHIPGSPAPVGPALSGGYFDWLFTASGLIDLRVRLTTFFTAGTALYGKDFYLEDVGAV
jgi:hypothetical protein